MPNLTMILVAAGLAWGVFAPLGTWAWMKIEKTVAVRSADKTARADEQDKCEQRIAKIEKELNDAAARQLDEARKAVASLPPVPSDDAGLDRLCKQSASCRDH